MSREQEGDGSTEWKDRDRDRGIKRGSDRDREGDRGMNKGRARDRTRTQTCSAITHGQRQE